MNEVLEVLKEIGLALFSLLVIAASTERGNQVLKVLVNLILEKVGLGALIYDSRTFLFVALTSWALTHYAGIDLVPFLSQFDWYNGALVEVVNSLIVMLGANLVHDKYFTGASR